MGAMCFSRFANTPSTFVINLPINLRDGKFENYEQNIRGRTV
jgi:hypothetical protein